VSNAAQSWAWKQNCGYSSDKSVLVALADNAWEDGSNAWPSVALLVRKTGLVRRTVQSSLRRLEVNGFIEMTAPADPGRIKPTTYKVCMDRDPAQQLRQVAQSRRMRSGTASAEVALPGASDDVDPAQQLRPPCAAVAPEPLMNQVQEPTKALARRTRVPEPFLITDEMRAWAQSKSITLDLDSETEQFLDYHRGKGTVGKDWTATWRTWMRNAQKWSRGSPARSSNTEDHLALIRRLGGTA
jgi:hypothetical protein